MYLDRSFFEASGRHILLNLDSSLEVLPIQRRTEFVKLGLQLVAQGLLLNTLLRLSLGLSKLGFLVLILLSFVSLFLLLFNKLLLLSLLLSGSFLFCCFLFSLS